MKIIVQQTDPENIYRDWEVVWDGRRICFEENLDNLIGRVAEGKAELHLELTAHEPEAWDMVLEKAFKHEQWTIYADPGVVGGSFYEIVQLCEADMERVLGPKVPEKIFIRITK